MWVTEYVWGRGYGCVSGGIWEVSVCVWEEDGVMGGSVWGCMCGESRINVQCVYVGYVSVGCA